LVFTYNFLVSFFGFAMKNKNTSTVQIPQYIRSSVKALSFLSNKWATKLAMKLFITPFKFPLPKREIHMDTFSVKYPLELPKAKKDILVYENGNGTKKALLIHGWNGRGTQLFSIAKELTQSGYTVISFDAPGHGKASKNTSVMTEFMEAAFVLERKYDGFDIVIGHSLGGMTAINVLSRGFQARKAVIIGSGDIIQDIMDDFIKRIGLKPKIGIKLKELFEKTYNENIDNYTISNQIQKVKIPVLIIHDRNDLDVPYTAAEHIYSKAPNAELYLTEKLGHRKILGNGNVLQKIKEFIEKD